MPRVWFELISGETWDVFWSLDRPFGCGVCILSSNHSCLNLPLTSTPVDPMEWGMKPYARGAGCLKFLPVASPCNNFQARSWATGCVMLRPKQPCIMLTKWPAQTKRPGHLHFLPASWSADLLILSDMDGLPSPSSHICWVIWAPLCGVYCEVIWKETAFWAPSKKCQPLSAHLLAPTSVLPVLAPLFL